MECLFRLILLNQAGNLFRCQGDVGSAKQRVAHRHRLGAAPNQLTGIIGRDAPNGDDWNPQFLPCAGQQVERGVRRSRLGDRSKKSPKCDVVGTVLLSFDGTVQLIVTGNPDNLPRSQAAARFRERSILAP